MKKTTKVVIVSLFSLTALILSTALLPIGENKQISNVENYKQTQLSTPVNSSAFSLQALTRQANEYEKHKNVTDSNTVPADTGGEGEPSLSEDVNVISGDSSTLNDNTNVEGNSSPATPDVVGMAPPESATQKLTPTHPSTPTSPLTPAPIPTVSTQTPTITCSLPVGETIAVNIIDHPHQVRMLNPAGSNPNSTLHIALHGAGQRVGEHAYITGLDSHTNKYGGITIYLEASPQTGRVWQVSPSSVDVRNLANTIQLLHKSGCGNPTTTSLSGYSMGAMLTSRFLCEHSNLISGAAMVAGVLPPTGSCGVFNQNLALFFQHGTNDPIVPFGGVITAQWVRNTIGADYQNIDTPNVNRAESIRQWEKLKCGNGKVTSLPYEINVYADNPNQIPALMNNPTVHVTPTCGAGKSSVVVLHSGVSHGWDTDNTPVGWTTETIVNHVTQRS